MAFGLLAYKYIFEGFATPAKMITRRINAPKIFQLCRASAGVESNSGSKGGLHISVASIPTWGDIDPKS